MFVSVASERCSPDQLPGIDWQFGRRSDHAGALCVPSGTCPAPAAEPPLIMSHGGPRGLREESFLLNASGRVVEITHVGAGLVKKKGGGVRGVIKEFSRSARRRLLKRTLEMNWRETGQLAMVTLTYPGNKDQASRDYWDRMEGGRGAFGLRVKADFKAWKKRWARRWGRPFAVWVFEFQKRGVPHFHLVIEVPEGVCDEEFVETVRDMWFEVVGSGSEAHRTHGVDVEAWDDQSPGAYLAGYCSNRDKTYQHEVPDGYHHCGKWWGVWGFKADVLLASFELGKQEFVKFRRTMRSYMFSKSREKAKRLGTWVRKRRAHGSMNGCWVAGLDAPGRGHFLWHLLRAVFPSCVVDCVLAEAGVWSRRVTVPTTT